jgi:hypothetical protein
MSNIRVTDLHQTLSEYISNYLNYEFKKELKIINKKGKDKYWELLKQYAKESKNRLPFKKNQVVPMSKIEFFVAIKQ